MPITQLQSALAETGYVHVDAECFLRLLGVDEPGALASLASLWEGLEPDMYMADGGRYRRRRHATFEFSGRTSIRKPPRPHFQSSAYNPLNGDVERWFAPVGDAVASHPIVRAIFELCSPLFSKLESSDASQLTWDGELHQFRIEALGPDAGLPTPEGIHRDGVDWVLVLLIARKNVEAGVTEILDDAGRRDSFMLSRPGEAVLLNDRRIMHGVTAIYAVDPSLAAYRDVLVVTWRRHGEARVIR